MMHFCAIYDAIARGYIKSYLFNVLFLSHACTGDIYFLKEQ